MKSGFEHKLLPPYRITKIEDQEPAGPDIESLRTTANDLYPKDYRESEDLSLLLPLQRIVTAEDVKEVPVNLGPRKSTSTERCADDQKGDYDKLQSIESPESARNSSDDVAWQLPHITLPEGGLSPL